MPIEAAVAPGSADDHARRRALEVTQSFLARAPAGSGKTELLIQRTLALLATVERPEAVVAVTFTRKAAGEMRARILNALEAAAGPAPAEPHARQTWELARRVRARDAELGWRLLETPSRLRVLTLDALALELVRRMPWLARFGGVPQPQEDPRLLYREAARTTLEALESGQASATAARKLVAQVDGDLDAAVALLAALLAARDQWLPLLVGPEAGSLRVAIEEELAFQIQRALAEARHCASACGAFALATLPQAAPAALPEWLVLAEKALTKEGAARKKFTGSDRLDPATCAALHRLRSLPPPALSPEQEAMIAALAELLPRAAAALDAIFAQRGVCDFVAVALAAARALAGDGAPTALACALDGQIRHLLVDEFQDTSQAQYQLLARLVDDWQPGDGRTLFLVGDPMQSIYRFRNARVELFLRAAEDLQLGPVALEQLQLLRNFRSQKGLVDWFNDHFERIFPAEDDPAATAAGFSAAQAVVAAADGPAAEIHALANAAGEAHAVADVVEAERAALPKGSVVAILVHGRGHLTKILPELRRRSIAYEGVKLERLSENQCVTDLLALARALHDPADRVAWLAMLRGPWCGLALADLHSLCGGDDAKDATIQALYAARREQLSEDGRRRAARVIPILEAAAQQAGSVPPRTLVEWCWQTLGGPQCSGDGHEAAAAAFFAALDDHSLAGDSFDADALAALKDLVAPPAAADRAEAEDQPGVKVKVMTVHQAKGLEFDTVILPGLHRSPGSDDAPLLRWIERAGERGESHWLIAAKPQRGAEDALYRFVGAHRTLQRQQEQLRLLYVAATRAKSRLHLFAAPRLKTNGGLDGRGRQHRSPLALFWPAVRAEFARQLTLLPPPPPAPPRAAAAVKPPPPLRRVPAGWAPPPPVGEVSWRGLALAPPPSAAADFGAAVHAADLKRHIGAAVHAALQGMAEQAMLEWPEARLRQHLWAAGIAGQDLPAAMRQVQLALQRTAADPRGQWILAAHAEAHCEWPLAGLDGGELHHAVIDRSFVDEHGLRWIIDFKNAEHEGSGLDGFLNDQVALYRPQLERYARLVAALPGESGRPVRCGLYFPLLAAWREFVPSGVIE